MTSYKNLTSLKQNYSYTHYKKQHQQNGKKLKFEGERFKILTQEEGHQVQKISNKTARITLCVHGVVQVDDGLG